MNITRTSAMNEDSMIMDSPKAGDDAMMSTTSP